MNGCWFGRAVSKMRAVGNRIDCRPELYRPHIMSTRIIRLGALVALFLGVGTSVFADQPDKVCFISSVFGHDKGLRSDDYLAAIKQYC